MASSRRRANRCADWPPFRCLPGTSDDADLTASTRLPLSHPTLASRRSRTISPNSPLSVSMCSKGSVRKFESQWYRNDWMGSGGLSRTRVTMSVWPPPESTAPEKMTIPLSGG